MNKVWIVARHEFVTTVKRIGYVFATFVGPVFIVAIMYLSVSSSKATEEKQAERRARANLFVVDETGLFSGAASESPNWINLESRDEARRRVKETKDATAIVIPADYVEKGTIDVWTSIPPSLTDAIGTLFKGRSSVVPGTFKNWLTEKLVEGLPEGHSTRALQPIGSTRVQYLIETADGTREESGIEQAGRIMSGTVFFIILTMAIGVTGGYLIQGIADEKENRVLEMVVSSITPTQLMAGKLLGLGGAGLLQVTLWSTMGIMTAVQFVAAFVLNPASFALCALLFLLGYLLFGSLMLGIGSLGANPRESTQYTVVLSIFSICPVYFITTLAGDTQGTLARVFSWFPLTAPATLILRTTIDPISTPTWEIAAILVLLLLSTVLALKLSARLYRMGLLLYGKRPGLAEIWRTLRSAGE